MRRSSGFRRRRTTSPQRWNRRKNLHVPQRFSNHRGRQGAEGLALGESRFVVLGGVWRREAGQAPPEAEAEAEAEGAERAEGQRF